MNLVCVICSGLFNVSCIAAAFALTGYVFIPTDFCTSGSLCSCCLKVVSICSNFNCKVCYNCLTSFVGEVLSAIGTGPVLNYTCCNAGCINLFVMLLIRMCDCRDCFVTADVSLTILTIYTCCVTNFETGFLNSFTVFCIYVICRVNFCLEICCFNCASFVREVLRTIGTCPIFNCAFL